MTRRALGPSLVVALALAVPASAPAKGVSAMTACGASGCEDVDRTVAQGLHDRGSLEGNPTAAAARSAPAPFYRLRITIAAGEERMPWTTWFVPGRGLLRGGDDAGQGAWLEMSGRAAAAMRRAVEGVRPFPAPRLESVRVGARSVSDPDAYRFVYTAGTEVVGGPVARDWVPVVLRARRPSPWTGASARVRFSPSRGELERDGLRFALPSSLAERIAADGGLVGGDAGDGGGASVPWLPLTIPAAAVALLLALRRRNSAGRSGVVRAWWAGHAPRRS